MNWHNDCRPERLLRALGLLMALGVIALSAFGEENSIRKHSPDGALDLSQFGAPSFSVYSARDGVPDEVIANFAQDRHGFMWAGSASTFARFDAHHWQTLAETPFKSMVRSMLRDRNGQLWASLDGGGMMRLDGVRWSLVPGTEKLLFTDLFESQVRNGKARLWGVGTFGVKEWDGGHWQPDPGNESLPNDMILSISETHGIGGGFRQWIGTFERGVWFRSAGAKWQHLSLPELGSAQIEDLLATHHLGEEELWVTTYGAGLLRINRHGRRLFTEENSGLVNNLLYRTVATHETEQTGTGCKPAATQ